jgi:hypothetical protein
MRFQLQHVSDLTRTLEREVEMQEEAAKQAIREYKKTILDEPASGDAGRSAGQREVQDAVTRYMKLLKSLDELRAQMGTSCTRQQPPCVG